MSETVKVMVSVRATIECGGEVEMSRQKFQEMCHRIDSAKGFNERERIADEVIEAADLDWRFGDLSEIEVEDFDTVD